MRTAVYCLAAVLAVALVLPALADDDPDDEVLPDVPVRVKKSLFHPPVRFRTSEGVIDSGTSRGHSGPWLGDVDV
jgi:hypothetical protein